MPIDETLSHLEHWSTIGQLAKRLHCPRDVAAEVIRQLVQEQRVTQQASSPVSMKPTRLYRRTR